MIYTDMKALQQNLTEGTEKDRDMQRACRDKEPGNAEHEPGLLAASRHRDA
jgi:hypothetical protein